MDTFVDSSWYYMRYCSPDSASAMVDSRNDYWMPMDQYIGGIEHAVLHLLYARFWTKVMRDLGLVKFDEPFKRLFTQGMLTHDCYYREDAAGRKRWFYPAEIDIEYDDKGRPVKVTAREDGQPVTYGGTEKMSKSKNNVVEPRDIIAKFGADTARAFVMFAGPPDQSAAWSNSGAEGTYRFLRRLWNFCSERQDALKSQAPLDAGALTAAQKSLRRDIHANLKQADFDYSRMQYNTVVSAAMKMLNALEDAKLGEARPRKRRCCASASASCCARSTRWPRTSRTRCGTSSATPPQYATEIIDAPWPQADEAALVTDEIELVVQVNGKLRASIRVPGRRRQVRDRAGRDRRRQRAEVRRRPGGQARDRRARQARQRGRLMRRRALLAGVAMAAVAVGGCGFQLRGAQKLPIDTLFLALPVNSALGAEIARVVRSSTNAVVVTDRKQAQAIFELLGESREREVLSINAQGRAREYQLRLRLDLPRHRPQRHRTDRADDPDRAPRHRLQRVRAAGEGIGGGAALPRHAERPRAPDGDAAAGNPVRCSSGVTPSAGCWPRPSAGSRCRRCSWSPATSRCWRSKRRTPSARWRASRATPNAKSCRPMAASTGRG